MTRNIIFLASLIFLSGVMGCSNKNPAVQILILATEADFGNFSGEILKTDGFNEFELDSLRSHKLTTSSLKSTKGLTFLLPARYANTEISSIRVNGQSMQFSLRIIKGYEYVLVTLTPGSDYNISARYQ
jgi:hypothetical protein